MLMLLPHVGQLLKSHIREVEASRLSISFKVLKSVMQNIN